MEDKWARRESVKEEIQVDKTVSGAIVCSVGAVGCVNEVGDTNLSARVSFSFSVFASKSDGSTKGNVSIE